MNRPRRNRKLVSLEDGWENQHRDGLVIIAERIGIEVYHEETGKELSTSSLIERIKERYSQYASGGNEPAYDGVQKSEPELENSDANSENSDGHASVESGDAAPAPSQDTAQDAPDGLSFAAARRRAFQEACELPQPPSFISVFPLIGFIWTISKTLRTEPSFKMDLFEPKEFLVAQGELAEVEEPEDTSVHGMEFRRRAVVNGDLSRRTAKAANRNHPLHRVSNAPPKDVLGGPSGVIDGDSSASEDQDNDDDDDDDDDDGDDDNDDDDGEADIDKEIRDLRKALDDDPSIIDKDFTESRLIL